MREAKEKLLFKNLRKEVNTGANGTKEYVIKNGPNSGKVANDANKHVCEVQLVHRSLLTARRGLPGHKIYAVVRNATEVLEFLRLQPGQRAAGLTALATFGLAFVLWPTDGITVGGVTFVWWQPAVATVVGLGVGVAVGLVTAYYCSMGKGPVNSIAMQSKTGHATNIIAGLGEDPDREGLRDTPKRAAKGKSNAKAQAKSSPHKQAAAQDKASALIAAGDDKAPQVHPS